MSQMSKSEKIFLLMLRVSVTGLFTVIGIYLALFLFLVIRYMWEIAS